MARTAFVDALHLTAIVAAVIAVAAAVVVGVTLRSASGRDPKPEKPEDLSVQPSEA
jgi:hypothetical protein